MTNRIMIIPIILIAFLSCRKNEIKLPAEKMYLVEYYYAWGGSPDSVWTFYVNGVAEINRDFDLRITKRDKFKGDFYTSYPNLTDSTKLRISEIIKEDKQTNRFARPIGGEYNDYFYFILMQGKNTTEESFIFFIPDCLPPDLQFVHEAVYKSPVHTGENQHEANQDSIISMFSELEKYPNKYNIVAPPPFLKSSIEFIPPY
ncbi:MAG: hypothetical protein ACK5M3_18520 [Dysgonomonas sp.]